MKAIYKKEMKGYLTSMVGYVFIFFVLFVYGIYFSYVNIDNGYPEIGYTLQYVFFIMLIGVPVLTMRTLAEERRQKTDQLLLTSPLKIYQIIGGKYLALESVFLIPLLVMGICPLILSRFGTVSMALSYTSVLGFFLLGSAQIAIGVFASSLTENQMIAAVLCFVFLFLSNVIDGISGFFPQTAFASLMAVCLILLAVCLWLFTLIKIKWITGMAVILTEGLAVLLYVWKAGLFEGLIQRILHIFDLTGHVNSFINGILDINGILYYLSVIGVCLFLSIQAVQKRRWN